MMEVKRTKIVCTIGPASSSVSVLTKMVKNGMNVARMNFSHGTHAEHKILIKSVRTAAKEAGKMVAILIDLQGPKIRVGNLPSDGVTIRKGEHISFSTAVGEYKIGGQLPVTYKQLHKDVKKDQRILLDDGLMEAKVTKVSGKVITAVVVTGGVLKAHKGMNLPDSTVSVSPVTEKDWEDLDFGLTQEIDWVALSFVTKPEIVRQVRQVINQKCKKLEVAPPKIIAKIERREAVERFSEILAEVDAVMVARGDLGIEIAPEQVPILQKEFVELCRAVGKPVVVATQMLDSMTSHPRATRAETSDVANAVIDHTDAVMLSGETAAGQYPDVTVKTMSAIIHETEASRFDDITFCQLHDIPDVATSIAQSLYIMAENQQVDAIASSVTYGAIAQKLNIFRPKAPVFLACPSEAIARQNVLRAGVTTVVVGDEPGSFVHKMEAKLRHDKLIKTGEVVAYVVAGPKEASVTIRVS